MFENKTLALTLALMLSAYLFAPYLGLSLWNRRGAPPRPAAVQVQPPQQAGSPARPAEPDVRRVAQPTRAPEPRQAPARSGGLSEVEALLE